MRLLEIDELRERAIAIPKQAPREIYFLLKNGKVVYVGQSTAGWWARIANHFREKMFDSFSLVQIEGDINEAEARYIVKYKPSYNGGLPPQSAFVSTREAMNSAKRIAGGWKKFTMTIRPAILEPVFKTWYSREECRKVGLVK